jgi:transcriptional antiterminator NusG
MADNNVKKWYVVRAVSGQENKIKAYIEQEVNRVGMGDYISQVLVPTEKVVSIKDGKKISKDKVYFPGYVMVEANLTGEIPHIIKSITGVIGFLGETKGGEPVPLRMAEVNRMLGRVDELSVTTENVNIPYSIDETVKVIDGPFNGFNGTIEKINEEKRKLEVMVKIFGRKTPLELSFTQVEKYNFCYIYINPH